jgi:anti-sigma regulatory factor (Ser/Thr protein kinase)
MTIELSAGNGAPGEARAAVAAEVAATGPPPGVDVDDVVLVTSELVTNAVEAGATRVRIDVQVTAQRLDLVVTDDAPGWPTRTTVSPLHTAGRGLSIVEHLAHTWTVDPRGAGKSVTASWFDRSDRRVSG